VATAALRDPWVLYPLSPFPSAQWGPIAWVALGVAGTAVQLGFTSKKK
jgi:hypothetical protein